RELTCLRWAAIGKTSWEMGAILGLTERTVNFHIHNACRKLGVHGRQAAITVALSAGLLPLLNEPHAGLQKTGRPLTPEIRQAQPSPSLQPVHHPSAKP